MKTQIIRLEPHDDLISARDKMTWGQTGRILLVWPVSGKLLDRQLDLTLLQRHSTRMGAQLALVSTDSDVRYYAHQLGIPVYRSLRQAQHAHWRLPRRLRKAQPRAILPSRHSPDSGWQRSSRLRAASPRPRPLQLALPLRLAIFSLGVLAVLSLAAVLLPTAELTLPVEIRSQSITLTLMADPDAQDINLAGVVPARAQRVIVEGRSELPVSGQVLIPNIRAAGRVVFTNLTDEDVLVPSGTVVLSQGLSPADVRFVTTAPASLPAGPGETARVSVQAALPGASGNIPAGSLTAIEGLVGARVSVVNPEATGGGRDRFTHAPSPRDRQTLHAELLAALTATAHEELKSRLSENDLLIPGSLILVQSSEETYEPAENLPTDFLSLHLRLEFEALVVSGADVYKLSGAVLDANLPAGFVPAAGDLVFEHRSNPANGRAGGEWQVYAQRAIQAQLDRQQVIDLASGQPADEAAQRLAEMLPLRSAPQIVLFPAWWPRLPVLPFRIHLQTTGLEPEVMGVHLDHNDSTSR